MKLALLLVFFCVGLIIPSESSSCYKCSSSGTTGYCWTKQEDDERTPKSTCSTGWCMTKTDIPVGEAGEAKPISTSRSCVQNLPAGIAKTCIKKESDKFTSTTCFCQGDLCNNEETMAETIKVLTCVN